MNTGTVVALAECGVGSALLVEPQRITRATATPGGPPASPWLARVLGGRLVLQGGITLAHPTRRTLGLGGAVDGLHALSMVAVGVLLPGYRRPAAISGGFAAVAAAVALRSARHGTPQ